MGVVAVTDHVFSDLDIERALLLGAGHELRFSGNSSTVDDVRRAVEGADAVLNCYAPMPAEVIDPSRDAGSSPDTASASTRSMWPRRPSAESS